MTVVRAARPRLALLIPSALAVICVACVQADRRLPSDVDDDTSCVDRCSDDYPNPPPCFTPVWNTDTCECKLVAAEEDAPCDDSNACTLEDRCNSSVCMGKLVDLRTYCDDGNECTVDNCDQRLGCVSDPDRAGEACHDDNICTFDSRCNALGECRWTNQYVCRQCEVGDPNACADENAQQNLCDGPLTCIAGYCEVDRKKKPRCDDPRLDPCQAPGCDAGDCTATPFTDGTPCSDQSSCTKDDVCKAGVCTGTAVDVALCACAVDADCAGVEDDDLCNGTMMCRAGVCVLDFGTIVVCDDTEDTTCSKNTCVPETGECEVLAAPDSSVCDDGDPCTLDDACAAGACIGAAKDCTKFNGRCLVGVCDRLLGCTSAVAEPGTACKPIEPCNPDGTCNETGDCVAPIDPCDDGDPCTVDVCDETADGGQCQFFGPDKPLCASEGVCSGGVGHRCELGEYRCDYASVAGWSAVERCDGKDDDCDGATDEDCIAAEACEEGALVGAWSGSLQACAGPFRATGPDAVRCGAGWHACNYAAMVDSLAGDVPPAGFYIDGSIAFEPGLGYRVVDDASGCSDFEGICGGAHRVQATTFAGVFADTVAFAGEAWGCDDGQPSASCATVVFDGVMCCADACDADTDCADRGPLAACTSDRCVAGRCENVAATVACPTLGVCAGMQPSCAADGRMVCDYRSVDGYEAIEASCDGHDNDCDGASDAADPDFAPTAVLCELQLGVCAGAMKTAERCVDGHWSACSANDYSVYASDYEDAFEGLCDGRDNNCDGRVDAGFAWRGLPVGAACDGTGACGVGVVECAPSRAGATCSTEPLGSASQAIPEQCNGKDDDCDGVTDEVADLDVSQSHCGTLGVCAGLSLGRCEGGGWVCDGEGIDGYGPETCDGRDNDCDGVTDDGFVAGGAALGAPCGPTSCPNGVVVCKDAATAACSSDIAPGFERCDQIDNDCDGQTDEGLTYGDPVLGARVVGQSCSGRGECKQGLVECGAGVTTCSTLAGGSASQAGTERCNGKDDDCDGLTDEGFTWLGAALGTACEGLGVCGAGLVICAPGGLRATCSTQPDGTASGASSELCNGADDDCDGATDEAVAVRESDCPSRGVCRPEMLAATCLGSAGWQCDYSASPFYQAGNERGRCDRLDNDCDGTTDEDFVTLGSACDGPDGDACARGQVVCDPGDDSATVCSGDQAAVETCNGQDDDCDGQTDELGAFGCSVFYRDGDGDGFGTTDTRCLCAPDAVFRATVAGDCDDVATAVYPDAPERCNGVDDDCDGRTDGADATDLLVDDPVVCELTAGVCQGTTKPSNRCVAGKWQPCQGADYAAKDPAFQAKETRCDGLDNDCDTKTDGTDEDVAQTRPLCELQQGLCASSRKVVSLCTAAGWQPCTTAIYTAHAPGYEPSTELSCDGRDNECDGLVDDDFAWSGKKVGQSCDGVGACGIGLVECTGDGRSAVCSTNVDGSQRQDQAEACNSADDDCDGATDEGLGLAQSPCRQVGVCAAGGVTASCNQGMWKCEYGGVVGYETPIERSCDERDNDCDGATDEDMTFGSAGGAKHKGDACGSGSCIGAVVCDNVSPAPGDLACSSETANGSEICDGRDNDCDGQTDEGLTWSPASGPSLALGAVCDGYGACGVGNVECGPTGGTTCSTHPDGSDSEAITETCNGIDDDCDRVVDDGFAWNGIGIGKPCDGVGACGNGVVECVAGGAAATCSTNPNGTSRGDSAEVCNGIDDDCDGSTDEGLSIASSGCRFSGVCTTSNVVATCSGAAGWTCDYAGVANYHAGNEVGFCDGRDNDCDAATDEDFPELGAPCDSASDADLCSNGRWACGDEVVAAGGTSNGAPACVRDIATPELCGGGDEDCDGLSNEEGAQGCTLFFKDHDGDGYGRQADFKCLCAASGEYTISGAFFDCDDDERAVHPGVTEVCNDVDDDCDAKVDEDDATGCMAYYYDGDADDYGVRTNMRCLCEELDGVLTKHTTPLDGDCDDTRASVHPGAPERCDGRDNDCDGASDDQDPPLSDCATYAYDNDGDTYGVTGNTQCRCVAGAKYTANRGGDCCDSDDRVNAAQSNYFTSANACGNFDYDCVAGAQPETPQAGSCACPSGLCVLGGCTVNAGWLNEPPACGQSGAYIVSCGALCLPGTEMRTQRCR